MSQIMNIDGSVLEGGGQILRMSVAFSAILAIPIRLTKIRAGRAKPGLAAQHLKGIQLVAQMCQAKLKGASIGSTEIEFIPGRLRGGSYKADTQTAGSISLLLQVALPCALFADNEVTLDLRGGTNADMAPQIDYCTEVFRPLLEKFGGTFDFDLLRRGYYPRGGGHVMVTVRPVRALQPVTLDVLGDVTRVFGWSFVAGTLPISLAHQMSEGFKKELGNITNDVNIEVYKEDRDMAPDNCSGIVVVCESSRGCVVGAAALGRRGADAGRGGAGAAGELRQVLDRGACLDAHAQDQVIILMSLASGDSRVRVCDVTLHTQTAMHVATSVAGVKFNVIPDGQTNIIECTGLGYCNKYIDTR